MVGCRRAAADSHRRPRGCQFRARRCARAGARGARACRHRPRGGGGPTPPAARAPPAGRPRRLPRPAARQVARALRPAALPLRRLLDGGLQWAAPPRAHAGRARGHAPRPAAELRRATRRARARRARRRRDRAGRRRRADRVPCGGGARVARGPGARGGPGVQLPGARVACGRGRDSLPGEGVLVWHVDERALAFRSAENDMQRKLLGLVEADGRGDLDRGHAAGGNRGDATDPWSGPPPWRRRASAVLLLLGACLVGAAVLRAARPRPLVPALGRLAAAAVALAAGALLGRAPVCGPGTPGMAPHDGGPTRVVLRNLSPAGPVMRLDVLVAPPAGD